MAQSGFTTETVKRLLIGAGAVYIDYGETSQRLLGATRGGNEFAVEREIKTIEMDGARGKVKGARVLIEENATIKANLLEVTKENIRDALAKTTITPNTPVGYDTVKTDLTTSIIPDTAHFKNVAIVGEISGSATPAVIIIKNPIGDGNLTIKTEDKNEAVLEVTFSAHYDPADFNAPIWEIRIPQIV